MPTNQFPSQARRAGGIKAKQFGNLFETLFERSARMCSIAISRMPDGCRQVGPNKLLRVKTPFDWILSFGGKTALIDTKTINAAAFPHSLIEEHQARDMLMHQRMGIIAGYIVWARKSKEVYYIPASKLDLCLHLGSGSIQSSDAGCVLLGQIAEAPLAGNIDFNALFRIAHFPAQNSSQGLAGL